MLKLVAVLVVLFLIYLVFFKKDREKEIKKNPKNKESLNEEIMQECPKCKTFVSKDEAILSNGKYFCSKECL